ncbi:MAG: RNA methyltransferase [Acidobacteriota bacterium]|nr:RNA methyltransferase [Acidobacteriota bacterium]
MSPAKSNPANDRLRPVASRQNSLVKDLRKAFTQSAPCEDGSVAIEGVKLVEEAIRSSLRLRAVFVAESAAARAERLLPQLGHHTECLMLPDEVFHSAVATDTPQGVAALVHPLAPSLNDLFPPESAPLILGCAGLQDPGNLGTILRSAEAFGASGVLCTEGTVSAANPKVARASSGSVFRLPCLKLATAEAVAALREHGVRLAVTSSHNGRPLHELDLTVPTAIFIGNEGQGVPRDLLAAADERVLIPHSNKVESLNAAIAASILLYEAHRQRTK